ncbi:hypothetical protein FDP41_000678 [Naegleria fowleri]|uniref:Uncharacterized protein n=1 Tax=Naegleria fowleri TaxID=5763 RepID=A0A6A5CHL1_NAEFO|nr:uncharacterized protein FDP41_000678 [Naegleria fowleri]KAF0984779.1 hypothetical protein FDP41_000678 [Naegleria fowleri]CAG4712275.1 unnamed protein product [Naegleria fowleri]
MTTTTERKSGIETLAKFLALHPNEKGEVCLPPNIGFFFQNSKTLNETIKEKGWTLKRCEEYTDTSPLSMKKGMNYVFNRSDFIERSSVVGEEDQALVASSLSTNSQDSTASRSSRKSTAKSPKPSSATKKRKKSREDDFIGDENEEEFVISEEDENLIIDEHDENQPKVHRTRSRVKQQQQASSSLSAQSTNATTPSASQTTSKKTIPSATTTSKNKTIDSFFKTVEKKSDTEDNREEEDAMILSDDEDQPKVLKEETKKAETKKPRKFHKRGEINVASTCSPTKISSQQSSNSMNIEDIFKNLASDKQSSRSVFSSPTKISTTKRVVSRK